MRYGLRVMLLAQVVAVAGCTTAVDRAEADPHAVALPLAASGAGGDARAVSFDAWLDGDPVTATTGRRLIRVVPVGEFSPAQHEVVAKAAEHLAVFYGLPVRVMPAMSPPADARLTDGDGRPALLASPLLGAVSAAYGRDDTAFVLAVTAHDLHPGGAWSPVFGLASLRGRVGACSLARFGDPGSGESARRLCLRRALTVSAHECGHMLSLTHCAAARCGMNAASTPADLDAQPTDFCPECAMKLAYATRCAPRGRYAALRDWYLANGFGAESVHCAAALAALDGRPASAGTRVAGSR